MVLGKLDRYVQKNETRPPSYTTHKNKFKMLKTLMLILKTIKIIEENIGSKIVDIARSNIFSDISLQASETKEKNKQVGLHQTKKLLHSKGNYQQNKKTNERT